MKSSHKHHASDTYGAYREDMAILSTLHQWDTKLLQRLYEQGQRRQSLSYCVRSVSRSGDGYLQLAFPVAAWLSGTELLGVYLLTLGVALAMERCCYLVLKNGLQRRRPQEILPGFKALVVPPDRFSFPSGHTSAAFCLASTTGIVFGGPFAVLYAWACGVAVSRVLLGAHFPGDTVAGAVIGSGLALLAETLVGVQ